MIQTLILSFGLAIAWVVLSNQPDLTSLLVGFIFGLAIMLLVRTNTGYDGGKRRINILRLPLQLILAFIYGLMLAIDVVRSGVDVAWRVMKPTVDINPGVHRISTGDETKNPVVAAISAHSITITPGEMVIDFESDDESTMVIHVLDKESSSEEKLKTEQARRLKRIRGVLGL